MVWFYRDAFFDRAIYLALKWKGVDVHKSSTEYENSVNELMVKKGAILRISIPKGIQAKNIFL